MPWRFGPTFLQEDGTFLLLESTGDALLIELAAHNFQNIMTIRAGDGMSISEGAR